MNNTSISNAYKSHFNFNQHAYYYPPPPPTLSVVFLHMSHHLDHMIREFFMVYTSCFATYNVLNNARWVLASVADPWKVSARSLQSCGHTVKKKLCQPRPTKQQQLYFSNIEGKKPSFDRSMCPALQYSRQDDLLRSSCFQTILATKLNELSIEWLW